MRLRVKKVMPERGGTEKSRRILNLSLLIGCRAKLAGNRLLKDLAA